MQKQCQRNELCLFSIADKTIFFSDLKKISENQQAPIELDSYVKKLNNSRRRVMLVNNILQNAQVKRETQSETFLRAKLNVEVPQWNHVRLVVAVCV